MSGIVKVCGHGHQYIARRCPACSRVSSRRRGSTASRGYGGRHQSVRAELKRRHPAGACGRCGRPGSWTDPADPLTAGHVLAGAGSVPADYQPEHRSCGNREMVARRGAGGGG